MSKARCASVLRRFIFIAAIQAFVTTSSESKCSLRLKDGRMSQEGDCEDSTVQTFSQLQARVYERRLDEANSKVDILQSNINGLAAGLEKLNSTLKILKHDISGLTAGLQKVYSKADILQTNTTGLAVGLGKVNSEVRILQSNTTRLATVITSLLSRMTAAEQFQRESKQSASNQINAIFSNMRDLRGIRLVGGTANWNGRVEVFHDGEWGTICHDSWDIKDANVACKMLGFSYASSAPCCARYGQGSGRIWLDDVRCSGTESSLWVCTKSSWGIHNCGHNKDASVTCVLA